MNLVTSRDLLSKAQGRSEFVVAVFADIRGFSRFSNGQEAPNIAMYIKRLYLQLLDKYFVSATYAKPTGDGLLLIFPYDEENLGSVCQQVVESCLAADADFEKLCAGDPMLNFKIPNEVGFGVARGTACCLYSGQSIIDYSGHLLNFAARLNDIARPHGVVLDESFSGSVLSPEVLAKFSVENVYLRGVAELDPVDVLCQVKCVEISPRSKLPIARANWTNEDEILKVSDMRLLSGNWTARLLHPAKAQSTIRVRLIFPNPLAAEHLLRMI